ncbi:craniofacial development protein 2-like [Elysia marginata]|uniref:Craniofacial development protein 2-like n=1 Tax=Elysia marginata TaxID=1093978 RepID=A0AAV4IVM5_9GAST|nr:craniofacial development protein 2-like [Elysia marginata]
MPRNLHNEKKLKEKKKSWVYTRTPSRDWPKTCNGEEQTSRPITSSANEGIKPDCAKMETADSRKLRFKIGKKFRIGTRNVRSMKAGTLSTVIKEVRRNKIIICGIAEHRWSGKGHFTPAKGGKIMYSGGDKSGYGGVAVYLDKDCMNMMLGYDPVNDRIMSIRLKGTAHNLTIIQTYAPTTQASEEERELFYDCLQQTLDSVQKQDEILFMGDFNAAVSRRMSEKECNTIGEYGIGTRNKAGEKLVEFCLENNHFVANTMFQNHRRRLYTWTHPDCSRHQIDYILAQNRWRSSIMGVRTLPGADCGTDSELLMAEVKTRLKLLKPGARPIRYDLTELPLNIAYKLEIKNRFEVLGRITEQMEPNDLATEINKIFKETAEKHIPKMKTKKNALDKQQDSSLY